jgi:tryptophan-rich sensory protein
MTQRTGYASAWPVLASFLVLCYAVAAIGGHTTSTAIPTWYAHLVKPSFNPPNQVFGPVWTVLYTLIAIAAWLVWHATTPPRDASPRKAAVAAFFVQLVLNFAWSQVFFGLHALLLSSIVIVALWIAILITLILFWRIRPLAGALFLPYLLWVSYATVLNLALYRLNAPHS